MAVCTEAETCRINALYYNTTQNFAWLRAFSPLLFVFASQLRVYPIRSRVVTYRPKVADTPAIKLEIA